MSKIYITVNENGFPDVWSIVETQNSIEFDESDLPEDYGVEFAQYLWKIIDGKLVRNIE